MRRKVVKKIKQFGGGETKGSNWSLWVAITIIVISIIATGAFFYFNRPTEKKVDVVEIKVYTDNNKEPRNPEIVPDRLPLYDYTRGNYQKTQIIGMLIQETTDANVEKPIMLPLLGKPLFKGDRWEYYTAADKEHLWRLPIKKGQRECDTDVNGCNEIYSGDTVEVPAYPNVVFKATIYKQRPYNRL